MHVATLPHNLLTTYENIIDKQGYGNKIADDAGRVYGDGYDTGAEGSVYSCG